MRPVYLILSFLLVFPSARAQTENPPAGAPLSGTPTAPIQDPQAVTVLNQVLTAAGGTQAISGVSDYTATGNITYHPGQDLQGTVKVQGLISGGDIRIDATLPTGVRSWAVHDGIVSTKTEAGKVSSFIQPSNVPSSDAFPYQTPLFPTSLVFPTQPLGPVLSNQAVSLSYSGLTQADSHPAHDIQLRRSPAANPAGPAGKATPLTGRSREVFVDSTSLQIVMTRETLPKNMLQEIHYSDYRGVNGVLMPFAISEVINNQQIWTIQLSQITFNSGLQDSAFILQ